MENVYNTIDNEKTVEPNIAELAADYIETYYKLTVLNINQKTADVSAVASFSMVSALLICFLLLFFGVAAALWIGGMINNLVLGFLLTGVFFGLVFLALFVTRKKFFYPVIKNLVIKSIL